nr:ABC transporter ATP-binding protein/permease [Butyrivibrio sp.]
MVPLAAFLVFTFKKPIKEYNKKFRREMENTSARVMEMVELVPVTRAHALEDEEINKMDKQVQMIAEAGYRLDIIQANFGAVSWACFQLFQIVCLVFTAFLAINGKIQVGDVVLYQSYFTTVVSQVSSLLTLLPTISKGLESVNSIGEILMIEDDEDDTGKPSIEEVKGVFDFENVSFAYPGSQENVIENMNMHVNQGETVAFVGESGAGKTTIINMLIGFMTPSNGRVLLDGQDMSQINLHSYRENLAVVPQNTILFSGTIRDNILYGTNDVTEEELNRVIDEAGLRSVIEKFPDGIETVVGEHGDKLSGGQKQRISIARALIRKPKVIILDEATSALDAISEREVTSAIDHMSHDRTTFIVAHKLATIEKADKIVVMQNGVIAEQGSFDELMKKKGYFYNLEQDYRG